ncbi:VOC family protein [Paenochrobactrum sp. BZR 588]|uniref:VOC family protein n=1 Tax=Paenochrobactrum TaxID=999488 RepID=UPI0035BC0929
MITPTRMIAVLPSNDLKASIQFYKLLGFKPKDDVVYDDYQMLIDGKGAELHLTKAPDGWLIPGKSPCGVYFYADNIDELAAQVGKHALHPPRQTPWGTYEFAASDPDENLVRIGRSSVD